MGATGEFCVNTVVAPLVFSILEIFDLFAKT
jgi:hypothetical protein